LGQNTRFSRAATSFSQVPKPMTSSLRNTEPADNSGISRERITSLVLGDLPAPEAAALRAQIAASPRWTAFAQTIESIVTTLRTDDSVAPPVELVRTLKTRLAMASASSAPSVLEWLASLPRSIASLVFDSRNQAVVAGFRGGGLAEAVHLAFSQDDLHIDLELTPLDGERTNRWDVLGQIDRNGATGPLDILALAGEHAADSTAWNGAERLAVDGTGMFSWPTRAGTYSLLVRSGDRIVVLPTIQIP